MNQLKTRFSVFCCTFIFIAAFLMSDETIFVQLATETDLLPIYVAHVEGKYSTFDKDYCEKLEEVLKFDLDQNGMTYILKSTIENDKHANAGEFDQPPKSSDWKALGAFYIVKMRIDGKKIIVRLFAQNAETIRVIEGIYLSGDLSKDRRQIHQLADTIHKTLFGTDGVANTRILYTLKTKHGNNWNSEVWEIDYDGFNKRQVTIDSGYSVTPLYVPPKPGFHTGAIFFVSYKTGQPKIYYQGLTDDQPRRFTYLKGNQLMPAISRQRDKLAFISDITGNPDLFIQAFSPDKGAIGKPYQIFSSHLATQGSPTFSPDGNKIAFVSNKDGSPRIYVIEVPEPGKSLNDIKPALITKRNRESTAPSWSPDGTKIAYCAVVQGTRQIWVYDLITREERQVTHGSGNKENPMWAPNSLHLVFNSSDKGSCDLYLINLNQIDATKITCGDGEKRFPCWEPI
jgi:TolB protein